MSELGMSSAEAARLSDALFPQAAGKRMVVAGNHASPSEQNFQSFQKHVGPETLVALLQRLNLGSHLAALKEEELSLDLLRSMRRDALESNMSELGMSSAEAAR
eukprot:691175-Prymnesium_polylepis.1